MRFDHLISLDPRLSAIAEMVGICDTCADIGSDHGRLGAFLLQTHCCRRMILTDISAPSLDKAKKLINMLGLESAVEFYVGDGASVLRDTPDTAVVAGMGGATISGIISSAKDILKGTKLVLQPNVDARIVRETLEKQGYRITAERVVRDARRLYVIIAAEEGQMHLSPEEAVIGPELIRDQSEEMRDYRAFKVRVLKKAISGAAKSKKSGKEISDLMCELAIWEGTK